MIRVRAQLTHLLVLVSLCIGPWPPVCMADEVRIIDSMNFTRAFSEIAASAAVGVEIELSKDSALPESLRLESLDRAGAEVSGLLLEGKRYQFHEVTAGRWKIVSPVHIRVREVRIRKK